MLYLIHSFLKQPITEEMEATFARLQTSHRAFVDSYRDQILVRGPTLTDEGGKFSNVMIAEFADRSEVDKFVAGEPLTAAGVMERVVVQRFEKRYPKE